MQIRLAQIMTAAFLYGAIMLVNWRISRTVAEREVVNFMLWMTGLHACTVLLGLLYGARHVQPIPEQQRWARRFVFGVGLVTPYLAAVAVVGTLGFIQSVMQFEAPAALISAAIAAPVFLVWWQAERVKKRHAPPPPVASNQAERT